MCDSHATLYFMRFLGIDYGTKRIGLALSDQGAALAFPLDVLSAGGNASARAVEYIVDVCKREHVDGIVMGESRNFKGEENIIMKEARMFAQKIETATGLPVSFELELMSTIQAERLQGRADAQKDTIDASAAAVILQSFLDKHKSGGGADMDDDEDR